MRILHLTDFHFRSTDQAQFDQNKIVTSLRKSLSTFNPIDVVCFTGDLVNAGNSKEDFDNADKLLLQGLPSIVGADPMNFFICEGNHDVHRNMEISSIALKLGSFKDISELDSFVKNENDKEFRLSLANHETYFNFATSFYSNHILNKGDIVNPLYSLHKRIIDDVKVGIVTINSAWRAFNSDTDKGNLLFPVATLKAQILAVQDCDFTIMLMHHPLSDFKEDVWTELEDLIYSNFDIVLSGHNHKKKQSIHYSSDEGIFCSAAPATLSLFDPKAKLGYTVFDINAETKEVHISNLFYDKEDDLFILGTSFKVQIPLDKVKAEQNKFRKTLKKRLSLEIEEASQLFISGEETKDKTFLSIFTNPILKRKSTIETTGSDRSTENISIEAIMSTNSFLIFGKDKSGKTSILRKVQIELIKGFSQEKIVVFYVDCKELTKDRPFNLERLLARYYERSRRKIKQLLQQYHLKILLDNYNPGLAQFNQSLSVFLENNDNVSFLACMEETLSRSYESLKIGNRPHSNLYIHDLSRREIRELTNKWPNLSVERKESVIDKIGKIFIQLNIPFNYWTVSLFLWLFEKNSEVNFHNSVEMIQLYVDGLLERNKIAFNKYSKINFEDFKYFIGELAYYLLKTHHDSGYSADIVELTGFIKKFRETNIKFVMDIEEIVDMLVSKGVIKKKVDSRYAFRLNGVFEYFLAYHMRGNPSFRDEIIADDHFYLSFSNELELYSGFDRKDEDFFKQIFSKTQALFQTTNELYKGEGGADVVLTAKISDAFDLLTPLKELAKLDKPALSPEQQDELLDEFSPVEIHRNEVERKRFYDTIELNPENLEKAFKIFARVYRNSSITNEKLIDQGLDFLLESACNLGFALVDETNQMEEQLVENLESSKQEKYLLKLMASFMPLIVQTFLFDSLAQPNLQRIIDKKIAELSGEKEKNQFKLLLLYFLIIDLDVKSAKRYIESLIDLIKLKSLMQTTLIKLYTYLVFKTHSNPELQSYIIKRIEEQTGKINPNYDKDEFQKYVERQKKIGIVKGKQS